MMRWIFQQLPPPPVSSVSIYNRFESRYMQRVPRNTAIDIYSVARRTFGSKYPQYGTLRCSCGIMCVLGTCLQDGPITEHWKVSHWRAELVMSTRRSEQPKKFSKILFTRAGFWMTKINVNFRHQKTCSREHFSKMLEMNEKTAGCTI